MQWKEIESIMKKNQKYADMLEYYDRTGRFPLDKVRKNFTLKEINATRLEEGAEKRRTSMSALLDRLIEKELS